MLKHLKRRAEFTSRETKLLIITALVAGFILSFNEWGAEAFNLFEGLQNLILAALIIVISLYVKLFVQKHYANKAGYYAEYKPWIAGFIAGLFLILLSNGMFIFIAFGGITFHLIEKLRAGRPKENLSPMLTGWISILGVLTTLTMALLAKILMTTGLNGIVLEKLLTINIWLTIYSILPIPFIHKFKIGSTKEFGTADGLKFLTASPLQYLAVSILVFIDVFAVVLLSASAAFYIVLLSFILMYSSYWLFYRQNVTEPSQGIYKYRFE